MNAFVGWTRSIWHAWKCWLQPGLAPARIRSGNTIRVSLYISNAAVFRVFPWHVVAQLQFFRSGSRFKSPCENFKNVAENAVLSPSISGEFSFRLIRSLTTLQRQFRLYIPFLGIVRPQPQFLHSCVCERFIYSQDRSTYVLQQKRQLHRGNI